MGIEKEVEIWYAMRATYRREPDAMHLLKKENLGCLDVYKRQHLAGTLTPEAVDTYSALAAKATISGTPVTDMTVFANEYLNVFTTGFHYAFGVAILAMVLSLVIFVINRKKFPDPSKKVAAKAGDATAAVSYTHLFLGDISGCHTTVDAH